MSERMFIQMMRWMIKKWGVRCVDYSRGCAACEAWKCFDYIFEHDMEEWGKE